MTIGRPATERAKDRAFAIWVKASASKKGEKRGLAGFRRMPASGEERREKADSLDVHRQVTLTESKQAVVEKGPAKTQGTNPTRHRDITRFRTKQAVTAAIEGRAPAFGRAIVGGTHRGGSSQQACMFCCCAQIAAWEAWARARACVASLARARRAMLFS